VIIRIVAAIVVAPVDVTIAVMGTVIEAAIMAIAPVTMETAIAIAADMGRTEATAVEAADMATATKTATVETAAVASTAVTHGRDHSLGCALRRG
jgi:hypothetical protein